MVTLNVAAAVLAASEGDGTVHYDFGPGNRSGTPDLEGRVMVTVKPNADFFGTVNASYHTQTRRYVDPRPGKNDVSASIFNVGLDATLTKYVQVKGEYYTNTGAEDGYAGLADRRRQRPGPPRGAQQTAVKTTGQWAQLTLKPIPELWLAVGTGSEAITASSKALPRRQRHLVQERAEPRGRHRQRQQEPAVQRRGGDGQVVLHRQRRQPVREGQRVLHLDQVPVLEP